MSIKGFFEHCLEVTKERYNLLLHTPKARCTSEQKELIEIVRKLDTAVMYGEITKEEHFKLKKEFAKYNFANIPAARAALTKTNKMK